MIDDILHKLDAVAILKPGDIWPKELGEELNWAKTISQLCAEASAVIRSQRASANAICRNWIDTVGEIEPPKDPQAEAAIRAFNSPRYNARFI
jgi:hypothetical protein